MCFHFQDVKGFVSVYYILPPRPEDDATHAWGIVGMPQTLLIERLRGSAGGRIGL